MAFVVITFEGRELDRRVLERPITVGRSSDCDVVVADQKLSRHHCRIEPENDSWVVIDLNSRNGTFIVNSRERIQKHTLHSGDTISAADVRITFHGGAFVPARPVDPPQVRERVESEHPTLVVPPLSRPMPVPKPRAANEVAGPLDDTIKAPLPFTRPPARPIVNPPPPSTENDA